MNFLQRIIQVTALCPDAVALVDEEKELSYRELEALSNAVAHRLVAQQQSQDKRSSPLNCVAILLPRSTEVVYAYLGIIKADACVLCLNDENITHRDLEIIRECSPHTIITTKAELHRFPEIAELSCNKLLLDEQAWTNEDFAPINLSKDAHPAHITFTSGTTGQPKGVVYSLRSRSHIVKPVIEAEMPLEPSMRKACVMDLSYTMGILGALVPLVYGGTAYIAPQQLLNDIPALAQFARRHRINRILLPNSVVPLLLREPGHGLTHILSSCERLEGVTPEMLKGIRLENIYGTSETGRITKYTVTGHETIIPIGTPDALVSVFLLDEKLAPVEDGQTGEIYVASPGLAMGYLHDEALTDERFLPCPFLNGERMYRTGDYAYRDEDGQFVYCGRQDGMVNIRGHRLHLGEIENIVLRLSRVRQAAVKIFDGHSLCLYYSGEVDPYTIKHYLRHGLPQYMMPHHIVRMETLPLRSNGKIDRSQLEKPTIASVGENELYASESQQYASEVERQLCTTMAAVLELEPASVNPQDDFFSLGGDSLSAMQWICHCHLDQLSFATIYTHRTPREIARHISQQGLWTAISAESDEAARGQWQPFNSAMQGMVDYQNVYPRATMWNVGQLYRVSDNVDAERLRRALEQVYRHHPALNSAVEKRDGVYGLRYHSEWQPAVEEVTTDESAADHIARQQYAFELENGGPLSRFYLLNAADGHYLFIIGHHVVLDGTSFIVLHKEIDMAYRGEPLPRDYFFSYLQQQALSRTRPEYDAVCQAIRQSLNGDGAPYAPAPEENICATYRHTFSTNNSNLLEAASNALLEAASNADFLEAAMLTVAEMSGKSKAQLDWTFHNRQLSIYNHSVGLLIRTTTVVADTSLPREEWLAAIRSQLNLQMAYANYDFSYCLEAERAFSSEYIEFNCLLPLQQDHPDSLLSAVPTPSLNLASPYLMEVDISFDAGRYELDVQYMTQRYDEAYIRRFCEVMEGMLNNCLKGMLNKCLEK